jgi:hypothetical protein
LSILGMSSGLPFRWLASFRLMLGWPLHFWVRNRRMLPAGLWEFRLLAIYSLLVLATLGILGKLRVFYGVFFQEILLRSGLLAWPKVGE